MYMSHPPDLSTPAIERAGFKTSAKEVSVLFEDFITGRGKLLSTTTAHTHTDA